MRTRFLLISLLVGGACSRADITGPRPTAPAEGIVAAPMALSSIIGNGTSPSPPGLVACYSGRYTGNDVVGGHNATVTGSVSYVPGYFANAFSINDNTADIVAPPAPSWDLSAGDGISLSAWFFPKGAAWGGVPGSGPIAEFENGSQIWVHSQVADPYTSFFADFAVSGAFGDWHLAQQGPGVIAQNAWNHGVATYSRTSQVIRLYVNGVLVNTTAAPGGFSPASGAHPFHIGSRVPGSFASAKYAFNGVIDEVQVYNRELTQADVTQMATATGTMCVPPATQFKVVQQPSTSGESGVPLAVQPWVALTDATGAIVINGNAMVTASLAPGSTGTLSGTTTVQAVNGIAKFTDLAINGTGSSRLQFTVGTLPNTGAPTPATTTTQVIRQIGVLTPPAGAVSGAAFTTQPVLQLQDAAGLPMSGTYQITAALASPSTGTLVGTPTVTTSANGSAAFTNLQINGAAGAYPLSFSSGALTPATVTVNLSQTVQQLVVTTPPSATTLTGAALAVAPVIELRDAAGVKVAGASDLVTVSVASGTATLGGTTTVAASAGVATFNGLTLAGVGAVTLKFTRGTLTVTSTTVTVFSGAMYVVSQPGAAESGVPLSPAPAVRLFDARGFAINTYTGLVTATVTSAAGQVLSTQAVSPSGSIASFPTLQINGAAGSYTVTFTSPDLAPTSFSVNVTQTVRSLVVTTPPPALVVSGTAFATPPVVELRDGAGIKLAAATDAVTVSVGAGTATLGGTLTVNAVGGVATFNGLSLNGSGATTLKFTVGTVNTLSNPITIQSAIVATSLSVATQPAGAVSGVPFTTQPVVRVLDANGALLTTGSSPVTVAIASGTGTLGGTLTVNTINGVAAFSGLQITGTGNFTLSFTSTTLTPATSAPFTVAAPVMPVTLGLRTQPSARAESGVNFAVQPVIELRDAHGNRATTSSAAITAVLRSGDDDHGDGKDGSGDGVLGGTVTVSAVNGVATFTNLFIAGHGTFTLTFKSPGLSSATSNAITTTQVVRSLVITRQPAGTTSARALGTQPKLELRDAANLKVGDARNTVTAAIGSGSGSLAGKVAVKADDGEVKFTNLAISGSGPITLTFSTPGVPPVTSNALIFAPVSYVFSGFYQGLVAPPALNDLRVANNATIEFALGGDKGGHIFADGYPATQAIACSSKAASGDLRPLPDNGGGDGNGDSHWWDDDHKGGDKNHEWWSAGGDNAFRLTYDETSQHYSFPLSPRDSWSGTCRQLLLKFSDGQTRALYFSFTGS